MYVNSRATPWHKRLIHVIEHGLKSPVFHCSMCGQCVLRSTGLVCPMRCPKQMRNGPCGGSMNGKCEVFPDRRCVWDMAYKRGRLLTKTGIGKVLGVAPTLEAIKPAVDWRLWGTPSWLHLVTGRIDSRGNVIPPKDDQPPTTGVATAGKAEKPEAK